MGCNYAYNQETMQLVIVNLLSKIRDELHSSFYLRGFNINNINFDTTKFYFCSGTLAINHLSTSAVKQDKGYQSHLSFNFSP